MANRAAILTEAKAHPVKVDDFPMPEAGPHQMIVKNHAVAFNPADAAIQTAGVLIQQFPAILGEDLAGEIVSVGPDVTRFKVGDRVVAMAADVKFTEPVPYLGSFQLYCRVNDDFAAKIPDNITTTEACVLPLCLCTAAASVLFKQNLALPYPELNPKPTGTVVLIWGASSSVGSCAVQLALAGGCEVASTSSAQNMKYCSDLGAAYTFDYKSPTIVDDVVNALKGKKSAGVFCCVQDQESMRNSARIASKLGGNKFVATVLPPLPYFSMPEDLPEDVTMGWSEFHLDTRRNMWPSRTDIVADSCSDVRNDPCCAPMWEHWLTDALANGSMKCKPDPEVVGEGLEYIQEALDRMAKGVSAKKLVVKLQ